MDLDIVFDRWWYLGLFGGSVVIGIVGCIGGLN